MRNKKGFTLIELLAVIVILAVIALIATPIIMNVINDAKKGAAKDSTYGYVKAVELASTQYIVKNGQPLSGNYTTKDGNLYNGSTKVLDVTVSGTKPVDNGSVTLDKGEVTKAQLTVDGFSVKYDGDKVTIGNEDSTNPTPKPTEEPVEPKSFATDSWDTIAKAVRSGNYPYKVGDTKEITLENLGTFTVRVVNTSRAEACSNSNYSESACGFVVEFVDVIEERAMNIEQNTNGGWPATEMRTYLNGEFLNLLPTDLKNNIIDTKVVSGHNEKETTNFTSTDKIYLLSPAEVWILSYNIDSAKDMTHQLDYYRLNYAYDDGSEAASKLNLNGEAKNWWLRTPYSTFDVDFIIVNTAGAWFNWLADYSAGVSPAFRIG